MTTKTLIVIGLRFWSFDLFWMRFVPKKYKFCTQKNINQIWSLSIYGNCFVWIKLLANRTKGNYSLWFFFSCLSRAFLMPFLCLSYAFRMPFNVTESVNKLTKRKASKTSKGDGNYVEQIGFLVIWKRRCQAWDGRENIKMLDWKRMESNGCEKL